MTVYVDDYKCRAQVRRLTAVWSHLLADDHQELIDFGAEIGLLERWLQHRGTHREHFDVTERMRQLAIRRGAKQITYKQAGELIVAKKRLLAAAPVVVQPALALDWEPAAAEPAATVLPVAAAAPAAPKRKHRWEKLETHKYRCVRDDCGLRYENELIVGAGWVRWWLWPDGEVTADTTTPECGKPRQ